MAVIKHQNFGPWYWCVHVLYTLMYSWWFWRFCTDAKWSCAHFKCKYFHVLYIDYSKYGTARNFCLIKFCPAQPLSFTQIAEIFSWINFPPCCKGHRHKLYVMPEKNSWGKNFAHESRGWKKRQNFTPGENFQLYNNIILRCTVSCSVKELTHNYSTCWCV